VVDSKIWQVPLRGFHNEVINPDDGRIDFWGDVSLDAASNPPRVVIQGVPGSSPAHRIISLEPSQTYREFFALVDQTPKKNSLAENVKLTPLLADSNLMTQFAILHAMSFTMLQYEDIHGMFPMNLGDLLRSGLGPIDSRSINPVTGKPFLVDGSAGDIRFAYVRSADSASGEAGISLMHVNKDGSTLPLRFTY
jgi:hypothetical protein